MKICIRNYSEIKIPAKCLVPLVGAFDSATPYIAKVAQRCRSKSYIGNKLPLKIICLEDLRAKMVELGGYESYCDPMAGIGISARIFGEPQTRLQLSDLDAGCCKVLRANFKDPIGRSDIFVDKFGPADLVFLDFNDFTTKRLATRYKEIVDKAAEATTRFLIINDCTPFYFRYGPKSFATYSKFLGKPIQSVPEYFRALVPRYRALGLHLVRASYFYETSFLLFAKQPSKLSMFEAKRDKVPEGFVRVEF